MRMTVVPRSVLLACSLALGGCTFVTQQDWNEKTDCLDEDQDGAVRNATCPEAGIVVDCDDNNAARAPGLEEIPYDGIDNDCDGADLLDIDGIDGHDSPQALFGTQNDIPRQTGQISPIGVLLRRTPAKRNTSSDIFIWDHGQTLR